VPQFAHARHLLQFNNYHKYTVDEHCIVAVDQALELTAAENWLGAVWRQITGKRTLLLALLIHDLGKGFVEDHSQVGAGIARDVAARFGLPDDEAQILEFLVLKHLAMAHVAFRRDVSDPSIVVGFARDVGSPEVLRMLTVLTAADVAAVGPGTWNRWKSEVLGDLYFRTLGVLDGESPSVAAERHGAGLARLTAGLDPDDPVATLAEAVVALAHIPGWSVEQVSPLYRTTPVGLVDQPEFFNAALRMRATLPGEPAAAAVEVLTRVKELERLFGRVPTVRFGPRRLDIDIIAMENIAVVHPRPRGTEPDGADADRPLVVPQQKVGSGRRMVPSRD
jgi:2-amino-4-hydroxy-6-hydroxymethyldihydropteridine diphosphokinase